MSNPERNWDSCTVGILKREMELRLMSTAALEAIIESIKTYDKEHNGGPPPVIVEESGKRMRDEDGGGEGSKKAKLDEDDGGNIVVIELPHTKTGLVIGRGGATLRELQDKSGCKLQVAAWTGVSDSRLIQIKGTPAQIGHAKLLMSEKTGISVEQMPEKPNDTAVFAPGATGTTHQRSVSSISSSSLGLGPQITKTLLVPNEHVGLAIGKGGETLKMFKSMSGANIQVQKEPIPGTTQRPITVQGSTHEVEQAMMLIMAKMASVGAAVTVQGSNTAYSNNSLAAYGMPAGMGAYGYGAAAPYTDPTADFSAYYTAQLLLQQQQQLPTAAYGQPSWG